MKKKLLITLLIAGLGICATAQDIKTKQVPGVVQAALVKQYPQATKISWEKENGNYEANWGGKSGEDNAVQFTPAGAFVQIEVAIPVSTLPTAIVSYVTTHYRGTKIKEAGKVTTAAGKTMYEAEVKGSDFLFDEQGNYLKED